MKVKLLVIVLFYLGCVNSFAQPDSNYFQQEVHYKIDVKLNDVNHTLSGFETIKYKNNSPHTLKYIYFHIWPNAYKNNTTDLAKQKLSNGDLEFYFAPESERGYIDSLLFTSGNDTLKIQNYKEKTNEGKHSVEKEYIDIIKVTLSKPLEPDSTVIISTPFFVKIPSGEFSRLGHIGQSYQITQWYPKPAVYDKNGWNPMPYLNQGEFYSEFGSFDVSITIPKNYLVAATGELTGCPDEERMLELKAKETDLLFKDVKVNKIGNLIGNNDFPPSSTEWKTLRYTIKNVHDFGWFADKRWYVLKGEYEFPGSGKLVSLWSFFTQGNSRYWKKSIQYLNDAIKLYSKWNGDYPYSIVQAVDGTISAGGGMEYPTVTVIGNVNTDASLETVIMHEVGHNWFYGILGSNEREHPWMDEGINSANELRYIQSKYPEQTIGGGIGLPLDIQKFIGIDTLRHYQMYYLAYKFSALENNDQPIEGKAKDFTDYNYAAIVYMKTAACFNFLRNYLGDELFDKCMHNYFDAWKFKHPQPNDLRKIFEKTSKKNLSWFFDDMLTTNKILDYKINKKKKPNTKSSKTFGWMKYEEGVEVVNKGNISAPLCVVGIRKDTIADLRWFQGFSGKNVVSFPNGNFDKIIIDPFYVAPEINHKNNIYKYKVKGEKLFARTEKPCFKFLIGYDNPSRSILYWTPVLGYNVYDGFQPGFAFYNAVVTKKTFEYAIMPVFGTKSNQLNGSVSFVLNSNYRKSKIIKSTSIGVNGMHYSLPEYNFNPFTIKSNFIRVDPFMTFNFRPKLARSLFTQTVTLRSNIIGEFSESKCDGCDSLNGNISIWNSYIDLNYLLKNKFALMPYWLGMNFRYTSTFAFVTTDFTISRVLNSKGKRITARAYFGAFLFNSSLRARYNLRADGISGYNDYTYSEIYGGRFEVDGLWSHQFTEGYANFKAPTAYAQSNNWNAGANLYCDLPIPIFKLFADFAMAESIVFNGTSTNTKINSIYDAGISCTLLNGVLNIYLPLLISKNIMDEYDVNGYNFSHRIRFSLVLKPFAPHRIGKTMKLF